MDDATKELIAHYRAENARLIGERNRLWNENRQLWLAVAKLQRATGRFVSLSQQGEDPCPEAHDSACDDMQAADKCLGGLIALDPVGAGK